MPAPNGRQPSLGTHPAPSTLPGHRLRQRARPRYPSRSPTWLDAEKEVQDAEEIPGAASASHRGGCAGPELRRTLQLSPKCAERGKAEPPEPRQRRAAAPPPRPPPAPATPSPSPALAPSQALPASAPPTCRGRGAAWRALAPGAVGPPPLLRRSRPRAVLPARSKTPACRSAGAPGIAKLGRPPLDSALTGGGAGTGGRRRALGEGTGSQQSSPCLSVGGRPGGVWHRGKRLSRSLGNPLCPGSPPAP